MCITSRIWKTLIWARWLKIYRLISQKYGCKSMGFLWASYLHIMVKNMDAKVSLRGRENPVQKYFHIISNVKIGPHN